MARNKTISLSEEVFERLKQEDNSSALIDSLLYKHFNSTKSVKELEADLKKVEIIEETNAKINALEEEKKKLEDVTKVMLSEVKI